LVLAKTNTLKVIEIRSAITRSGTRNLAIYYFLD
jgi:hypothetical protein